MHFYNHYFFISFLNFTGTVTESFFRFIFFLFYEACSRARLVETKKFSFYLVHFYFFRIQSMILDSITLGSFFCCFTFEQVGFDFYLSVVTSDQGGRQPIKDPGPLIKAVLRIRIRDLVF